MLLRTGQTVLPRLMEFEVTNGPDLKVYLSASDNVTSSGDVTDAAWISLGPLKGNIGDQTYSLPTDADPADFRSVVIWFEQFGVLFSAATLMPDV